MKDCILCGASAYNNKFWINDKLPKLPKLVVEELKIMCVLFVEDVGGVILLHFDKEGNLFIDTQHDDADYLYDEIGAKLKIKKIIEEKEELFRQLENYYKLMIRGKDDNRS